MRIWCTIVIAALAACAEHGESACPAGQQCCRSSDDCAQSFEACFAPGEDIGCGACSTPTNPCQQDTECTAQGPTFICATPRCSCNGELDCIAGCADDAACGEGLTCGADHRCVALACSAASPCPANFDCESTGCVRRSCSTDGVCDGVCVEGRCFETFGFCSAPPA